MSPNISRSYENWPDGETVRPFDLRGTCVTGAGAIHSFKTGPWSGSTCVRRPQGGADEREDDYCNPHYLNCREGLAKQTDTEPCSNHRLGVRKERNAQRSDH